MGESLTERLRVVDEALLIVKTFYRGGRNHASLSFVMEAPMTKYQVPNKHHQLKFKTMDVLSLNIGNSKFVWDLFLGIWDFTMMSGSEAWGLTLPYE